MHTLVQFFVDLAATVAGQALDKALPAQPEIVALVVVLAVIVGVAVWRKLGSRRNVLPDAHETDGAEAFDYLRNSSKWSEREVRRLNFRELVNCRQEFRRAARDEGLRTSGISRFGGLPEAIDARHWIAAGVAPGSEDKPFGLASASEIAARFSPQEFNVIKVNTNDMKRVWPRASWGDRLMTRVVVATKRVYYLLTPDAWAYRWRRWTS